MENNAKKFLDEIQTIESFERLFVEALLNAGYDVEINPGENQRYTDKPQVKIKIFEMLK